MKEFDLKSIWEGADQNAKQWYQHLRPELIAKAKKQNDSVLHKIRRLTIIELVTGGIGILALLYYIRGMEARFLGGITFLLIVIMYISYYQYKIFKQKADQVPTLNVIASTKAYLELINDYRKRLNRIAALLIPFSIVLGFFIGLSMKDGRDLTKLFEFKTLIILIPTLIVLSILSILATKWYYRYFIGSKEKELQAVLDSMEQEG